MVNAFPTGVTASGQLAFGNHVSQSQMTAPVQTGNHSSLSYKAGYYGAPLLLGVTGGAAGNLTEIAPLAPEEIPSAQSLAADVAGATGGTLKELKSGYSVTAPQGSRGIMVRIMEEGGGRTNYYRVSIPGKQTFTVNGEVSTDPALTHIPISSTSLQDIIDVIEGIGR